MSHDPNLPSLVPRLSTITFTPIKNVSYTASNLNVTLDDRVSVSLTASTSALITAIASAVHGTVRFIGPISDKSKAMYGIELDTAVGKHDGSYNKQEYFRCGNKRGIFVVRSRILSMDAPNGKAPRITVGSVVKIAGGYQCKGVVKYIGVPAFKRLQGGNWYGIELRVANGKHDGSVNGIRYFSARAEHGIFVSSKLIKVCRETHNEEIDDQKNNEITSKNHKSKKLKNKNKMPSKTHGLKVTNISSHSLSLLQQRKKSKKRVNRSEDFNIANKNMLAMAAISEDAEEQKIEGPADADDNHDAASVYHRQFIIHDCGYPISFLLSDKKADIDILKHEIIHTFGHVEKLDNSQIYIKNVDQMCLLVRITFRRSKSHEKAVNWKFYWKNKSIRIRKHAFKKWREEIEVKHVFPICFRYPYALKLTHEEVKKFLIAYCNNLEELLQNKSQMQFEDDEVGKCTKVVINFANRSARDELCKSEHIDLSLVETHMRILFNDDDHNEANKAMDDINANQYKCQLIVEEDCVSL